MRLHMHIDGPLSVAADSPHLYFKIYIDRSTKWVEVGIV